MSVVLIAAYTLVKDLPGGFADQRMSHQIGLEGTIQIPIGKTPEDAVLKFRDFRSMQIIHKESVKGGELLFIKRFNKPEGTDLQIEFVRKSWLGWKWVWGGGYAIGGEISANAVLTYAVIPKVNGIHTPFPMVYGEVLNASITQINVVTDSQPASAYTAQLINPTLGQKIWFTLLPQSVSPPLEIQALNAKGDIVARQTIDDLTDVGEIKVK